MTIFFKTVLFCSVFYLFLANVQATTIAIIRNQNAVYVGADSRIMDQFGQSLGTECKITPIGDYFFVHAGLGSDSTFGFDIKTLAQQTFTSPEPFPEQMENFVELVNLECTKYLWRIRNKRPAVYERIVSGDVNIETAIIGCDTTGTPFFRVVKFAAEESGKGVSITTPILYDCPGDCQNGQVVALLGQMQQAGFLVDRWSSGMLQHPVRAIKTMIGREIEHNPKVGPPISILKVSKSGAVWVQHAKTCQQTTHILKEEGES